MRRPSGGRTRRTSTALIGFGIAGTTLLLPAATAGGQAVEPVVVSYGYSGQVDEFVVPDGVCTITVSAGGAEGGSWDDPFNSLSEAPGGLGGRVTGDVAVTPGDELAVLVGGRGGDGTFDFEQIVPGGAGGFPDGGDGGTPGNGDAGNGYASGGGGGGASGVVSVAGGALLIAPGGGGAGGYGYEPGLSTGGDGGTPSGADGGDGDQTTGGAGATQAGGGAGGTGSDGTPAASGSADGGGDGGGGVAYNGGGGGGGGGLFGGGGGGGVEPNEAEAGGGGGGAGLAPEGAAVEDGVEEGDGYVTISYDPADQPTDCETPTAPTTAAPTTSPAAAATVTPRFTG